ncbi:MAG: hypothetical protein AB7D47_04385 [Desulfovibrio sp.]
MSKAGNYVQDLRLPKGFHREARFLRIRRKYGSDGVVAVLLLWDWVAEQFPTSGRLENMEIEDIADVCCVDMRSAGLFVQDLLYNEWFLAQAEDGTYYLPRWSEEQPYVANAEARAQKARKAAEARWGKGSKKGKNNQSPKGDDAGRDGDAGDPACGNANAMPPACSEHARSNADAKQQQCPNTNTKSKNNTPLTPLGGEREGAGQKGGRIRFAESVTCLFAELLPELPQPHTLTERLVRDIHARCREDGSRADLGWWRWFFGLVREHPYPMGEGSEWQASLGWLVTRRNMDKILDGHFQTREALQRRNREVDPGPAPSRSMSLDEFERMQQGESIDPG